MTYVMIKKFLEANKLRHNAKFVCHFSYLDGKVLWPSSIEQDAILNKKCNCQSTNNHEKKYNRSSFFFFFHKPTVINVLYISKLAIRYNKKNPTLKIICKTIIWYYYDHSKFSLILKRKYMLENKPLLISRSILTNFHGGTSRQILALNKFMFHCTNIKTRKFLFFNFNIV